MRWTNRLNGRAFSPARRRGRRSAELLALNDDGRTAYDTNHAAAFAAMGRPVFACTTDQFPKLMATALKRGDICDWAASRDIAPVRAADFAETCRHSGTPVSL